MKKTTLLLSLVIILAAFSSVKAEKKGNAKILGTWEFKAPTAPYPYNEGTMTFSEVEKALKTEFTIQGQTNPAKETTFENDEVTIKFEVEYNPVTLKMQLVDGKLIGKADSPNGPVEVTATMKK